MNLILGLRNVLTPEGFQLLIEILLQLLNIHVLNPELFLKFEQLFALLADVLLLHGPFDFLLRQAIQKIAQLFQSLIVLEFSQCSRSRAERSGKQKSRCYWLWPRKRCATPRPLRSCRSRCASPADSGTAVRTFPVRPDWNRSSKYSECSVRRFLQGPKASVAK